MAPDHRTRSPLRERERAISPKRRKEIDYGHDAESHVRHIARTKQLTTFAGEQGTPREWSWVLQGLVYHRSTRGLGCPIDLLDQIIYGVDGAPEALFHTTKCGGTVALKPIGEDDGCITLAKAVAQHLRPSKRYLGALEAVGETNGAVAFTSGEAVAVKSSDLEKIRKGQGTVPAGTEALVLLVPTKARAPAPCAELLLSIQHTFKLELGSAKVVHRSYRVAVVKGDSKRVPCKSSTINQKLNHTCKVIVEWIEAYSVARVLNLVLEFVEDALGKLWLVRSSECIMTRGVRPYSVQRHSPSPEQSKASRLEMAKGVAGELSVLRYGYGIGESVPSPPSGLPHATFDSGRLSRSPGSSSWRRPNTAMSPAEVGPKGGGQGSVDAEEWGFGRSDSSPDRQSASLRRPQTTTSLVAAAVARRRARRRGRDHDHDPHKDVEDMFRGFAAPGEHHPRLVGQTAAAGRALGSSQLGGMCHGDFCDVDLLDKIQQRAKFEREETGNGSLSLARPTHCVGVTGGESSDKGAFRKHILQLDEAVLQDHGVLPDAMDTPRTNAGEKGLAGGFIRGKRTRGGRGWGGSGSRPGRSGGLSGKEPVGVEQGGAEWSELPFSWIVRGRQERHLIDQQLRRYRRSNKEPFVNHLSSLGESSVSLGALFPGTYYQRVRVCNKCYRVYTMIDSARTKSVKRLESLAAATSGQVRAPGGGEENDAHGRRQNIQPVAKRIRGMGFSGGGGSQEPPELSLEVDPSSHGASGEPMLGTVDDTADPILARNWDGHEASQETLALRRAQAAIDGLTRGDICELRSFSKPPAAVNMVAAALMIALTGDGEPSAAGWLASKRFMTNVDRLFALIAGLDLDRIKVSQIRKLESYARNPAFRPEIIACVSLPAAKLCAWVLGVLEAHRWRTGRGHPHTGLLGAANLADPTGITDTFSTGSMPPSVYPKWTVPQTDKNPSGEPDRQQAGAPFHNHNNTSARPSATSTTRDAAAIGPAVFPFPPATPAATASTKDKHWPHSRQGGEGTGSRQTGATFAGLRDFKHPTVPQGWVLAGAASGLGVGSAGTGARSPTRVGTAPSLGETRRGLKCSGGDCTAQQSTGERLLGGRAKVSTRAGRVARGRQERTADRLADATAIAPDTCGFERGEYLCTDGVTLMPYAVVGKVVAEGDEPMPSTVFEDDSTVPGNSTVLSFVAVHDFFDTLETTYLLFKPLVLRHPGCQVLCFNSPGQAGTQLPPEPEGLLTNEWVADRLNELMQHVDNMGLMPLSDRPFQLVGIGNGASVASSFACRYASSSRWKPTLRTLACINGFASVDAQLAAVLHSVQGAFRSFPPERPDLPFTFWSSFIFSDAYLKAVGSDLAINIFCAVANPLGAEGMVRIVKGALRSRDLRKDLLSMDLPLILVQSTDNLLVNAANVDPFLEGRRPRHVWSHQLRLRPGGGLSNHPTTGRPKTVGAPATAGVISAGSSCFGPIGERALFESLSAGREGAFVAWVKGGHEIRQECKIVVADVLELLAAPRGQRELFYRKGVQQQRAPGGGAKRVGIAKSTMKTAAPEMAAGESTTMVPPSEGVVSGARPESGGADNEHDIAIGDSWNGGAGKINVQHKQMLPGKHGRDEPEREGDMIGFPDSEVGGDRGGGNAEGGGVGGRGGGDVGSGGRAIHSQPSATTYGYASLRKIREQKPLPTLPRRSDKHAVSPTTRGSDKEAMVSRARPRSITNLGCVEEQARRWRGRRGEESTVQWGGNSVVPCPLELLDWKARGDREDVVVPLGVAVADFDSALRDHRNKRRGRTSGTETTSSPPAQAPQVIDDDFLNAETNTLGATAETVNEGINPSAWFDGNDATKAEFTLVDGGMPTLPTLRWTRSADGDENAGNDKETSKAKPGTELTSSDLPQQPYGSQSVGKTTAAAECTVVGVVEDMPETTLAANTTLDCDAVNEQSNLDDDKHSTDTHLSKRLEDLQSSLRIHNMPEESNTNVTEAPIAGTPSPQAVPAADPIIASAAMDAVITEATAYREATTSNKAVETLIFPVATDAMKSPDLLSTIEQRTTGTWIAGSMPPPPANDTPVPQPPSPLTVAKAEVDLEEKIRELESKKETFEREEKEALDQKRSERLGGEQARRANEFAEEDRQLLADEERRLAEIRRQADLGRLQRGAEFEETDAVLVCLGAAEPPGPAKLQAGQALVGKQPVRQLLELDRPKLDGNPSDLSVNTIASQAALALEAVAITGSEELESESIPSSAPYPVRGMRPQHYTEAEDLPEGVKRVVAHQPAENVLDDLESLAARAKVVGQGTNIEEFEQVEQQQRARQVERLAILHGHTEEERRGLWLAMAIRLQMFAKSTLARHRVARLRARNEAMKNNIGAIVKMQSLVRAHLDRNLVRLIRRQALDEAVLGGRATTIQRVYRGRLGRGQYAGRLRDAKSRVLQRAARGFLGRRDDTTTCTLALSALRSALAGTGVFDSLDAVFSQTHVTPAHCGSEHSSWDMGDGK